MIFEIKWTLLRLMQQQKKKLKINDCIAAVHKSEYHLVQLLCKNHTIQKLDQTNQEGLDKQEEVKQEEVFEKTTHNTNLF